MKKMRKVLSLIIALAFLFSVAAPAMAATPTDAEKAGNRLLSLKLIEGYPGGGLGLDQTITRAEITVILARIAGMGTAADLLKNTPSKFSDVKVGEWYTGWINLASSQGWVKGDPQGTFRPNDPVQYREIITMLMKALGYNDNLPGDWPVNYLAKASTLGVSKGITFDAKAAANRGDVFRMTSKTLDEDTVSYDKDNDKFVSSGKSLLEDKMSFEKKEGVVTDIPRVTSSLKDNQIKIKNTLYKVIGDVDFEEIFGTEVDAWLNDDGDIVFIDIDSDTVLYDAIEFNKADDEITLIGEDKDYDLADNVTIFIDGESKALSKITDGSTYDYAKIVLDDDGDVAFIDAYKWEDTLVVEKVDGYDVYGYGDELDVEDYTIVKDGLTIKAEELVKGDILFYTSDAGDGYAEVFNKSVVGKMESVFESEFEVKNEDYTYENADFGSAGIAVKYINEDGEIADFDSDAADQMKDAGDDVSVFVDRRGNAVFVSGDLGTVTTSTVALFVTDDVSGYFNSRGKAYLAIKGVNASGKEIEYDFPLSDVEKIKYYTGSGDLEYKIGSKIGAGPEKYDKFIFVDNSGAEVNTTGDIVGIGYKDNAATPNTDDIIPDLDAFEASDNVVVEVKVDADGDVCELAFFAAARVASITDELESGDKYAKTGVDYKLKSDTLVYNLERYDDDADDIKVTTWSSLKGVKIASGDAKVFVDEDGYVKYLVVDDTGAENETEYLGVVSEIRKTTDGDITRIKAYIDGVEKTLSVDYDKLTGDTPVLGEAFKITVDDESTKVIKIEDADQDTGVVIDTATVDTTKRTFKSGSSTYKLVEDGYVYDVTDPTDIDKKALRDLKNLDDDNEVTVVFQSSGTTYFVALVLITKDGTSGGASAGEWTMTLSDVADDATHGIHVVLTKPDAAAYSSYSVAIYEGSTLVKIKAADATVDFGTDDGIAAGKIYNVKVLKNEDLSEIISKNVVNLL